MPPAECIGGSGDVLLLCDHASSHVPAAYAAGIPPALRELHIGVDIGAGALTRALAARIDAPAVLGTVSRLVIDLHRQPDHAALIPKVSDGHVIPANADSDRQERIARYFAPFHAAISDQVRRQRPAMIVAIHSFTRRLQGDVADRPWHAGILYGRDRRLALPAIDLLRANGIATGDNQPYSGMVLNATLNRHAEAQGIPSLLVEVRNDLIDGDEGVQRWSVLLAEMIAALRNGLAQERALAT